MPMPGMGAPERMPGAMPGGMRGEYPRMDPRLGTPPPPEVDPNAAPVDPNAVNTNNFIVLTCRAVNLSSVDPSANSEMAYAVENEIKNSPLVDPKATQLTGQITSTARREQHTR